MASVNKPAPGERERRTLSGTVEFRKQEDGPGTIVGYAALFNEETVIGRYYGFREVIAPGAFAAAIKNDDVRALFNHNADIVLGRNKIAKTLRLDEDKKGLRYEVDLPDTVAAGDVRKLIERGDVSGSSFAFTIESDDDEAWDYEPVKKGQLPIRTIKRVSLYDVSPVTYPAYEGTSISARSEDRVKEARALAAAADAAKPDAVKALAALRQQVDQAKAWGTS
jgi:HK97 family phage prohead protease